MKTKIVTALVILATSTGMAAAKAHDQGVADGEFPESTSETVQSIEGPGVSSVVNNGARGASASENRGDNRVEPVVGNGRNSRDD